MVFSHFLYSNVWSLKDPKKWRWFSTITPWSK